MSENAAGRGARVVGRGIASGRRGYQQLLAWQRAHELALAVFRAFEPLRRDRLWLANQVTRSAVSVAANIAEGYNRGSLREYIQFLSIARGSLGETEYHVLFAKDGGLIPTATASELDGLIDTTGSLLLGLIRSLQAKDGGRAARIVREARQFYETSLADATDELYSTLDPRPSTPDPAAPEAP